MKPSLTFVALSALIFGCGGDVDVTADETSPSDQADVAFTEEPNLGATVRLLDIEAQVDSAEGGHLPLTFDDEGVGDLGLNVFTLSEIVDLHRYADAAYIRVRHMDPSYVDSAGEAGGKIAAIEQIQSEGHRVIMFGNQVEFKGILVIQKDGSVVIAYRGTSIDDPNDIATDITIPMTTSRWAAGKVHRGFYKDFESTWDAVYTNLFEYAKSRNMTVKDLSITAVGHSLGGTAATLASYRLAKVSKATNVRLLTFGSPRVLDEEAAADFEQMQQLRAVRICQQGSDLVCALTPGLFGYKHVGHYVRLSPEAYSFIPQMQAHKLDEYGKRLRGLDALPSPNNNPSYGRYVHSGKYNPIAGLRRALGSIHTAVANVRRWYLGTNALIENTLQ